MTRRELLLLIRDLSAAGLLQRALPALLLLPGAAEVLAQDGNDSPANADLPEPPEQSVQHLQELVYEKTQNLMSALTDVTQSIVNLFPGAPTLPSGDVFGFLSVGLSAPLPFPTGPELEAIDVVGYSSEEGPYAGVIGAGGGHIGTETNNVEAYRGTEATLSSSGVKTGGIAISGVNTGLEVPFLAGVGVGAGTFTSGGRGGQYVSGNIAVFSTLSVSFGFGFQLF